MSELAFSVEEREVLWRRAALEEGADRSALDQCRWVLRFDRRRAILRGRAYEAVKRGVDLLVLVATTPVVLPIVLVCALLLKFESPGSPVLFAQQRTGRGGRRFVMYKFRTMVEGAEELKASLAHLNQRQWPDFKIENDPRITRIGRLLRVTSLDELPQLLNVLRGDMALVGPRPTWLEPTRHQSWQLERFEVRPGVTGLWQVGGRSSVEFAERVRLEIAYVHRRCLALDLAILARTIPAVVRRRGAC